MKQKSKLKDLIEDIVDSDLLALDESDYQSQEESRDEDEDDDLEEAEDEESEGEDEKMKSEGEDKDEEEVDEASCDYEMSEGEDEESEDEESEDEESEDEESEDEDEEDKKEVEEKYENFKVDLTNVSNLIESEEGLTEEFKSKAALIFEAEVKSQLRTIKEGLENKYSRRLEEAVSFVEDKLTEQIDGYLTYAVQQWMKENQVAIESSLRTEIAENFMGSLKTLFTESYVEVPASKLDLYAKLEEEKQEVEAKLGRSLELLGGLVEKVEDLSREKAIEEACEGLTQTQAVRLKKLAESVEFSDESSFKDKVQTLKEFYFADKGLKNKTQKTLTEEFSNYEDSEIETIVEGQILSTTKIDPEMSQYLKALNAMNKSVTY